MLYVSAAGVDSWLLSGVGSLQVPGTPRVWTGVLAPALVQVMTRLVKRLVLVGLRCE